MSSEQQCLGCGARKYLNPEDFVLKVRIKFEKERIECVYPDIWVIEIFSKGMRRADIPIKSTVKDFAHQIMSLVLL